MNLITLGSEGLHLSPPSPTWKKIKLWNNLHKNNRAHCGIIILQLIPRIYIYIFPESTRRKNTKHENCARCVSARWTVVLPFPRPCPSPMLQPSWKQNCTNNLKRKTETWNFKLRQDFFRAQEWYLESPRAKRQWKNVVSDVWGNVLLIWHKCTGDVQTAS